MSVYDPTIVSKAFDPPLGEFELIVPPELFFLRGHFPDTPVLPGIVQVHWAISLARLGLPLKPTFFGVEALKFHRIIGSETRLKLVLEHVEKTGKLNFSYTSGLGLHSQGRILFR